MLYGLLINMIIGIHFLCILFIVLGFILTMHALFFRKEFFDRWLFRSVHLLGIVYYALLSMFGQYCPLTLIEKWLRSSYDASSVYTGSFVVHYVRKLIYPRIDYSIIKVSSILIGLFIVVVFIARPPEKIKGMIRRLVLQIKGRKRKRR